jgi:deazaflavin-dependent oxidoreductase (nitroreductase family)
MHIPRFMRGVNRVFTNPLMLTFAGYVPPLAIVHHVGRKSGKRYRTPIVALPTDEGFAIPMTYGRDVDWARNLVAAGGGEIERMGRRQGLSHPRIVGMKAAAPHLPAAVRPVFQLADFPGYVLLESGRGAKAKKTSRRERHGH